MLLKRLPDANNSNIDERGEIELNKNLTVIVEMQFKTSNMFCDC